MTFQIQVFYQANSLLQEETSSAKWVGKSQETPMDKVLQWVKWTWVMIDWFNKEKTTSNCKCKVMKFLLTKKKQVFLSGYNKN